MTTTTSSLLYFTNVRYIHCILSLSCVSKLGKNWCRRKPICVDIRDACCVVFCFQGSLLRLPIYGLGFNLINAFVGFVFVVLIEPFISQL